MADILSIMLSTTKWSCSLELSLVLPFNKTPLHIYALSLPYDFLCNSSLLSNNDDCNARAPTIRPTTFTGRLITSSNGHLTILTVNNIK